MKAKENTKVVETNHYKACFNAARSEFGNQKNRRTERLLPSDLTDTGMYQRVEHYFLPCDASGKLIEGAEPFKMTSKGSKLYKFGD